MQEESPNYHVSPDDGPTEGRHGSSFNASSQHGWDAACNRQALWRINESTAFMDKRTGISL